MPVRLDLMKSFIEVCQQSRTIMEVVERTGVKYATVRSRLGRLKRMGIPIQPLERSARAGGGYTPEQIEELKRFAVESLQQSQGGR